MADPNSDLLQNAQTTSIKWKASIEIDPVDIETEVRSHVARKGSGNPYLSRAMIHDPGLFFWRASIVRRVYQRISVAVPQSVSIVGERRIGKSSFLNHIRHPLVRVEQLLDAEKQVFVLVDFQSLKAETKDGVFRSIVRETRSQLAPYLRFDGGDDFDGLRAICDAVSERGFRLVYLFDEFESATTNEHIGRDFFAMLKSIANNFSVSMVTATASELHDICINTEVADSPFFNIFSAQQLGLLNESAARELISSPSSQRGYPLAAFEQQIIDLSGRHPLFLQIACAASFDQLESSSIDAATGPAHVVPTDVIESFEEEATGHFEYIAGTLTAEEREVLKKPNSKRFRNRRMVAVERLAQRGYIARNGARFEVFSKSFDRYLKERKYR